MLESMRIYIERFGRPYNYLKTVGHLNNEREKHLVEEEKTTKSEAEQKKEEFLDEIEESELRIDCKN